jgi:hypothetical protein
MQTFHERMYHRVAHNLATVMATAILSLPNQERQEASKRLLNARLDLELEPITGQVVIRADDEVLLRIWVDDLLEPDVGSADLALA